MTVTLDAVTSKKKDRPEPALVIVEGDGSVTQRSFAQMSRASDRLASWLSARGVVKGDPVVLMLGNQLELWESMLAVMKLGAVLLPTTTVVNARAATVAAARTACRPQDSG
jgi:acetyl-CoA synthetase